MKPPEQELTNLLAGIESSRENDDVSMQIRDFSTTYTAFCVQRKLNTVVLKKHLEVQLVIAKKSWRKT